MAEAKQPSMKPFPFFLGCKMRFKTSNIDVEVKYKKAGNELLVPRPNIIMRTFDGKLVKQVRVVADNRYQWNGKTLATEIKLFDPDTEEQIPSSEVLEILEHYKYKYIDEEGNIIEKVKDQYGKEVLPIQYFGVQEGGEEEECSPFSRTNVIEVVEENWVPSTSINGFVFDSVYEIFADSPAVAKRLFEEAEKRLKKDQVGVTSFSWGGFIQYYAFLCPLLSDGKFVWLMKLSNTKLLYNYLQEPPEKAEIPIREAPKLKVLPPVQALVVAAKRKKKQS